jgi:rhamnosyltransferase
LETVGGFPAHAIVDEDTYVAARMLLAGRNIAYCAEAEVFHSHDFSWKQGWQRYFDIEVFHARNPWLGAAFGAAEEVGLRFLKSEVSYLVGCHPGLIPQELFRLGVRWGPGRVVGEMSFQTGQESHECTEKLLESGAVESYCSGSPGCLPLL